MNATKRFTKSEELANAISHGLGTVLSVIGLIILVLFAVNEGDINKTISLIVFGSTMVLLYLSSTLNHSLKAGKIKDFFHNFDQIAIFLLIAGTYTPIALVSLIDDWGWVMFGAQWGFAFTGVIVKLFLPNNFEKGVNIFFIISYVIMGWMLLFFLFPILRNLQSLAIIYILIGGVFYTLGTIFFKIKNLRYSHLVWHLFVIAGSVFHWIAIRFYIMPM